MVNLGELAWHRAVGSVIDALDQNDFWLRLTRLLGQYVRIDSWVALRFSDSTKPLVLAEMPADDGLPDPLFEDYLNGLYLLDPFYIAARESRREGLLHLDEVAPDRFASTAYYTHYFRLNIVEDEVQFNCLVEQDATFCLSLGSHQNFSPADLALLSVLSQWVLPLLRKRWRHELRLLAPVAAAPGAGAAAPDSGPAPAAELQPELQSFRLRNASLSSRELEITRLLLSGFSSKGIAQRLGISAETVKVHRKHLYAKLGINSQSELFSLFLKDTVRESASV